MSYRESETTTSASDTPTYFSDTYGPRSVAALWLALMGFRLSLNLGPIPATVFISMLLSKMEASRPYDGRRTTLPQVSVIELARTATAAAEYAMIQVQLEGLRQERARVQQSVRKGPSLVTNAPSISEMPRLEHDTMNRRWHEMQAEMRATATVMAQLQRELGQARQRIDSQGAMEQTMRQEMQAELDTKEEAVNRLEQELKALRLRDKERTEDRASELQFQKMQADLDSRMQTVNRLEQELAQTKNVRSNNDLLWAEKSQLEERLAAAELSLGEANAKARKAEQKAEQMQLAASDASLQGQLNNALRTIDERTAALKKAEHEVEWLRSTSSSQVSLLWQENQKLRQQVNESKNFATSSVARTSGRILELQEVNDRLEKDLAALREESQSENDRLRNDVNEKDSKVTELHAQVARATSMVRSLQSNLSTTQRSLAETTDAFKAFKTEATLSQNQVSELSEMAELAQCQLKEEQERRQELENEMNLLQDTIQCKDTDLTALSDELSTAKASMDDLENSLAATSEALERAMAEKDASTHEMSQLQVGAEHLTEERNRLQTELAEAQDRLDELLNQPEPLLPPADLEALQSELSEKEAALTNANKTIQTLETEKDELSLKVVELRRAANEAQNEETRLRSLLEQTQSELNELVSADDHEQAETVELLESKLATVEQQLAKKQEEMAKSRTQLALMTVDRKKLSADLELSQANLLHAQKKIQQLERDHAALVADERLQHDELDKLVQARLREASAFSKEQLAEAQSDIHELHEQLRSLEASRRKWKHEAESLAQANDDLSFRLNQMREQKPTRPLPQPRDTWTAKNDGEDSWYNRPTKGHAYKPTKKTNPLPPDLLSLQDELDDISSQRSEIRRLLESIRVQEASAATEQALAKDDEHMERGTDSYVSTNGLEQEQQELIQTLTDKLRQSEQQCQALRRQMDVAKQSYEDRLRQVRVEGALASKKHAQTLDAKEQEMGALVQENLDYKNQLGHMEQSLRVAQEDIAHLRQVVEEWQARDADRAETIERLEHELAVQVNLTAQVANLLGETEEAMERLKREYSERVGGLQAELAELEGMQGELNDLVDEHGGLHADVNEIKQVNATVRA